MSNEIGMRDKDQQVDILKIFTKSKEWSRQREWEGRGKGL